jgi:hypothetical protein
MTRQTSMMSRRLNTRRASQGLGPVRLDLAAVRYFEAAEATHRTFSQVAAEMRRMTERQRRALVHFLRLLQPGPRTSGAG